MDKLELTKEEYMEHVCNRVLRYFPRLTIEELRSDIRTGEVVKARALAGYAIYFYREDLNMTEVGHYFRRADHTATNYFVKITNTVSMYDEKYHNIRANVKAYMVKNFGKMSPGKRYIYLKHEGKQFRIGLCSKQQPSPTFFV